MVIVILTFDPIIGAMIYQIEHIGVILAKPVINMVS